MNYSFTPVKRDYIEISPGNNLWWECGAKGTFDHFWWEYKLVELPWKIEWKFLKKLKLELQKYP